MSTYLILDVGGVLASNLTPWLWDEIAMRSNATSSVIYKQYKEEISAKLWIGEIEEMQLWEWLQQFNVFLNKEEQSDLISSALLPLPALMKLEGWSRAAKLIIMSNHRHEWLLPLLQPYQQLFTNVYISSQVSLKKPDRVWFETITAQLDDASTILFVDDSKHNIAAAANCGWEGILADEQGKWIKLVDAKLSLPNIE